MKYTKKQITKAIAHWTRVLESMSEDEHNNEVIRGDEFLKLIGDVCLKRKVKTSDIVRAYDVSSNKVFRFMEVAPDFDRNDELFLIQDNELAPAHPITNEYTVKSLLVNFGQFIGENNGKIPSNCRYAYGISGARYDVKGAKYDSGVLLIGIQKQSSHNSSKSVDAEAMSQAKVNAIGQAIEKNVAKAFDKAMNARRPVVQGDPVVTKDNRDELEEEVLDKLFGGGNDKAKNDIGPENAWNLYGDMINCSKEEFVTFYNYVKEKGY